MAVVNKPFKATTECTAAIQWLKFYAFNFIVSHQLNKHLCSKFTLHACSHTYVKCMFNEQSNKILPINTFVVKNFISYPRR